MSINIVKGGKLVRVASNVDGISSTEKGAGGGIATLDENAKVSKSQIPKITALDTNATRGYAIERTITKLGWHRVAAIKESTVSFSLGIEKNYNNYPSEGHKILIRLTNHTSKKKSNFTYMGGQAANDQHFTKIRTVYDPSAVFFYIDMYYNNNTHNVVSVTLNDFSSPHIDLERVTMNSSMNDIAEEPAEDCEVYEFLLLGKPGIVADYAIADKDGNNIMDTYLNKQEFDSANILREWKNPSLGNPNFHMGDTVRFENLGTADEYFRVTGNSQIPYGSLVFVNNCYIEFPNAEILHWTFIIYNSHVVFGTRAKLTTPSANIYAALESDIQGISNPQLNIQNIRNTSITGCNIAGYCHILNNAKFFSCYFCVIGIDLNLCQMTNCHGINVNAGGIWKLSSSGVENKYPI